MFELTTVLGQIESASRNVRDMKRKPNVFENKFKPAVAILVASGLFILAVSACGGDGGGGAGTGGGQSPGGAAPTATPVGATQPTPVPPTPTPIPEDSAVQSIEETGLVIDSIELDPGSFGGSVEIAVTNASENRCTGAVIMVSLLREDGTQAGEVGIRGQVIEPGETKNLKDRYFGTVSKAEISSATCEDSTLGDHGAPGRAHTPAPEGEDE